MTSDNIDFKFTVLSVLEHLRVQVVFFADKATIQPVAYILIFPAISQPSGCQFELIGVD